MLSPPPLTERKDSPTPNQPTINEDINLDDDPSKVQIFNITQLTNSKPHTSRPLTPAKTSTNPVTARDNNNSRADSNAVLKEHLASQLRQSKHHKGGKSSVTLINGARNQLEKDKLIGRYNSRLEQTGKRSNLSNTSLNRNMTQRMLLKNQSNFSSVSTI